MTVVVVSQQPALILSSRESFESNHVSLSSLIYELLNIYFRKRNSDSQNPGNRMTPVIEG